MSISTVIEKLEAVKDEPRGKLQLYFTQKRPNGKYVSFKAESSVDLQKELIKIVIKALDEVKDKQTVAFNPSGSLDETIEECDYEYVESLNDIKTSLETTNLLEETPGDLSKFTFYCLIVELENEEKMLFFRRVTKFKRLKEGLLGQFVDGEFVKISAELLGIDGYIDIIGYNEKLTITNHIAMERIFNITAQYQESAKQTLDFIKKENRIENFDQFEVDSINDGRIIRGLTKLLNDTGKIKNCFDNFDKVRELVNDISLNIKFTDDGQKLVYENKEQLQGITLILRDAYYRAYISERFGVDELA